MSLRNFGILSAAQQILLPFIVHPNPAAPINFMEKPVHYYQEDDDRQQPGRGLQIESWNALRKIADDSNSNKPCNDRRKKSNARTHRNRTPMHTIIANHTCRYRREHQNAFQPFSKNEDADVKNCYRLTAVGLQRIRRAFCRDSRPYKDHTQERSGKNTTD